MRGFIEKYPVFVVISATLLIQFIIVGIVAVMLPDGADIHDSERAHMVFRMRAFGPLLVAMFVTHYLQGKQGLRHLFASYLKWKVPARWYLLAFSWKFLYTYVGIAILFFLGIAEWPGWIVPDFVDGDHSAIAGLMRNMPFIVGIAIVEETTWMKFCVTRLQERYPAYVATLVVGICWGLWYLPMLLLGDGVPDGYPVPFFLLSMFSLTVFLSWTFNMTRSGLILLIMQIVANCAFFIIPVLPGWHELDPVYVNAFVWVNFTVAMLLFVIYGPRELSSRGRAKWSDGLPTEDSQRATDKDRPTVMAAR